MAQDRPLITWPPVAGGFGALVALLVLVACLVLTITRGPSWEIGLIAAVALARLT